MEFKNTSHINCTFSWSPSFKNLKISIVLRPSLVWLFRNITRLWKRQTDRSLESIFDGQKNNIVEFFCAVFSWPFSRLLFAEINNIMACVFSEEREKVRQRARCSWISPIQKATTIVVSSLQNAMNHWPLNAKAHHEYCIHETAFKSSLGPSRSLTVHV